ncbi:MAG: hypothetical protein KDK71_02950 [Chlamydiia bacterium]|nr:hypothetical protein [Chlamydiia bacterium]
MKSHDISERSNKSPSARSSLIKLLGITNGFKMIAFISAETVYFLSAVLIVKQSFAHNGTPAITENNSGLLFKAAAIGVLLGSLSHFLIPRKKYHSSYRTVITYTYFFGFSTLFLSTHSAQVFHDQQAVLIFIGSIAFFGAIYIPLVFSLLFKQFHAPHRGIASAVGEGAQGLAEWIAPFIALLLVGNYQFGYFLSGLYLISFILNILSHWFAVRNGEEE